LPLLAAGLPAIKRANRGRASLQSSVVVTFNARCICSASTARFHVRLKSALRYGSLETESSSSCRRAAISSHDGAWRRCRRRSSWGTGRSPAQTVHDDMCRKVSSLERSITGVRCLQDSPLGRAWSGD
jgi:hypothetical protein